MADDPEATLIVILGVNSMRNDLKVAETTRPRDTEEVRLEIRKLVEFGYRVIRKTDHQIKIRDVNYYPSTGTITIDPCTKFKDKGFEALLDLLSAKYPKPADVIRLF
jgi:hypothetical protein